VELTRTEVVASEFARMELAWAENRRKRKKRALASYHQGLRGEIEESPLF
jgi:hypothetical protein